MAGTAPLLGSKDITVTWGEAAIEFTGNFDALPATKENDGYEVDTSERSISKNSPNKKYDDYTINVFFDKTVRDAMIADKEAGTVKVLKFDSKVESATWSESYNAQVKKVGSSSGETNGGQASFPVIFTINSKAGLPA